MGPDNTNVLTNFGHGLYLSTRSPVNVLVTSSRFMSLHRSTSLHQEFGCFGDPRVYRRIDGFELQSSSDSLLETLPNLNTHCLFPYDVTVEPPCEWVQPHDRPGSGWGYRTTCGGRRATFHCETVDPRESVGHPRTVGVSSYLDHRRRGHCHSPLFTTPQLEPPSFLGSYLPLTTYDCKTGETGNFWSGPYPYSHDTQHLPDLLSED